MYTDFPWSTPPFALPETLHSTVFCASRRTFLLYPELSDTNSCAAFGFAGDAGFGSWIR